MAKTPARLPYGAVGGLTFAGTGIAGTIDENDAGTFDSQRIARPLQWHLQPHCDRPRHRFLRHPEHSTAQADHNFIVYYVSPSRLD